MRAPDWLKLAGGRESRTFENGLRLRLLSARELLEARREAMALAEDGTELALCSNACLAARAVTDRRGRPVYRDGGDVLDRETPRRIEEMAKAWSRFRQEEPGLDLGKERLDALKKAWSACRGSACSGVCSGALARGRQRRGHGA